MLIFMGHFVYMTHFSQRQLYSIASHNDHFNLQITIYLTIHNKLNKPFSLWKSYKN